MKRLLVTISQVLSIIYKVTKHYNYLQAYLLNVKHTLLIKVIKHGKHGSLAKSLG